MSICEGSSDDCTGIATTTRLTANWYRLDQLCEPCAKAFDAWLANYAPPDPDGEDLPRSRRRDARSAGRREAIEMKILDRHDGEFGISSWTVCADCTHRQDQQSWFAIRAGERHYVSGYQHYHADCAAALVNAGRAEYRVPAQQKAS
jgi:hypothetical protein